MRITHRLIAVTAAAVVAFVVYHAATWRAPDAGLGPRLRFEEGMAYDYAIEHHSRQRVVVPELGAGGGAPAMTGEARLEGHLILRGLAPADGMQRFALRFADLTAAELRVQGQSLIEAPLTDGEAVVSMRGDGEVVGVRLPVDAPPAFHAAVHLVLGEIQVRLGDGAQWTAREATAHGEAQAEYRRVEGGFERRRLGYALQAVRGEAEQAVDGLTRFAIERGRLVELVADEALTARRPGGSVLLEAESHTRLTLVEVGPAARVDHRPLAAATRLGAPIRPQDPEAQARRQRIGNLTAAQAREMLAQAAGGRLPEHNRTLWRLTALLREDAALCEWIGRFAGAPGRTEVARALMLDLLTSAGTPAAQAALRTALDSEATRATEGYAVLYQRAGLLARPEPETLRWLADRQVDPGPEGPTAANLALGAAAGAAARGAAGPVAAQGRALADGLLDEALAAEDATTRAVRLRALGNAAVEAHAEAIAGFAGDGDPQVRHAAAAALRRVEGPAAHAALMDLAVDGDARVQGRALTSLGDRPLTDGDLGRLAGAVRDGTLAESSLDRVVDRLMLRADPAARAVLDAILGRDLRDSRIKGRIRAMLGA